MQVHSALLWAFLCLASHVYAGSVYAHYMVGTVTDVHAQIDVEDAMGLGLDGFALNIGDPTQPFVLDTVRYLFDAAKAAGGFTLHISMDVYASGSACYQAKLDGQQGTSCNGPDDYADILKFAFGYIESGTYTKGSNGQPLVTTFSSGGFTNDRWSTWKANLGQEIYFCPDFDETDGWYGGSESYDGWYYYWGDVVDCLFSWESAWPVRSDPLPGTVGGAYPGDVGPDVTVQTGAIQRKKGYFMGLSMVQYKNSYNANVYRSGGLNLPIRMSNILGMSTAPDAVVVITWNDGPESHYIGNNWPESNTDWQPAYYVNEDWSHQGWKSLVGTFIQAFKSGDSAASMSPLDSDFPTGALWYKTQMSSATCPYDNGKINGSVSALFYEKPFGYEAAMYDTVYWAVVVPQDNPGYTLNVFSGGNAVFDNVSLKSGLNYGQGNMSPGNQYIEVLDADQQPYAVAWDGFCVASDCYDYIYNFNYQVLNLVDPGSATSPAPACNSVKESARFIAVPKPLIVTPTPYADGCTAIENELDNNGPAAAWEMSQAGVALDAAVTKFGYDCDEATCGQAYHGIDDLFGANWMGAYVVQQPDCDTPGGTLCPTPPKCPPASADAALVAAFYVQKAFSNFHEILTEMQTSVLVAGLVTSDSIRDIIDNVATPLVDMASTSNIYNLLGGVFSTISPAVSTVSPGASAISGVLGGVLGLIGSSLPSTDPDDLLDDIEEILYNRTQTVITDYVDQLTALGQIVFKTNDFDKIPSWVDQQESDGENYANPVSEFFANGRFIGNYTSTTIPDLYKALEANILKTLVSVTLASAGVYVGVNVGPNDDCDSDSGVVMDVSVEGVLDGSYCWSLQQRGDGASGNDYPDYSHAISSDSVSHMQETYGVQVSDIINSSRQCQDSTGAYNSIKPASDFAQEPPNGELPACLFNLPVLYLPDQSDGTDAPSYNSDGACAIAKGSQGTRVGVDFLPDSLAGLFTTKFCTCQPIRGGATCG